MNAALAAPPAEYGIAERDLAAITDAANLLDQLVAHFAAIAYRLPFGTDQYFAAGHTAAEVERLACCLAFIAQGARCDRSQK